MRNNPSLIATSPEESRALLTRLLREKSRWAQSYPLSYAQERLWFLAQLEPENPFYNVSKAVRLTGAVDVRALELTLSEIIRRHEVLRTRFELRDDQPVQIICAPQEFILPVEDLTGLPAEQREAEAVRISTQEAQSPFDLAQSPLLRARLLKLGDDRYVLLLTLHHIAADGWSMRILVRELTTLYRVFRDGERSPLDDLSIQYADYAVWQRGHLQGSVFQEHLDYWRTQLSGAPPLLALPADRARPPQQSYRGANHSFRLTADESRSLRRIGSEQSATLFMTLLAAFKALLYRYSRETDIVVGTDIAGRTRPELQDVIGFFVNQLVLRTRIEPCGSFKKLVERVREVCLGAYAHQEMPFERVVEELQPERSLSYGPLFQVSFIFGNARGNSSPGDAGSSDGKLADVKLDSFGLDEGIAKTDLTLAMGATEDRIGGTFEYNTDLFDASTIQRLARHFQNLLRSIAESAGQSLSRLSLLDEQERQQLLVEWNRTEAEYPKQACLHELFEAAARHNPSAIAVICGEQRITYGELDERAEQLAAYLRSRGVRAEQRVGLLLDRSTEMLVGVLGVLKAGGAYVPLDAGYPLSRLAWMLADAGVTLTLSKRAVIEALKLKGEGIAADVVCLDEELVSNGSPAGKTRKRTEAGNAAYVIYTSGSTGTPKAAVITHEAAVNYTVAVRRELALEPGDRILQFASPSFDVFVEEVFPTWAGGAAVVVMEPEEAEGVLSVEGLNAVFNRYEVTGCELPAAFWHEWSAELTERNIPPSLKWIIIGCEKPMPARLVAWQRFNLPLIVVYGLTETAITSTLYKFPTTGMSRQEIERPPIGRPIDNTQIYLLDDGMEPVPAGVAGEMYIGGVGLARGYHNLPAMTADRFVPNAFSSLPGERLYRTGDLARYYEDGRIEFLRRIDHQVKIRGFRIEPGEVEAAIRSHHAVKDCVLQVRQDPQGDKRLTAYVVCHEGQSLTVAELRGYLKQELPGYMIPSFFVMMDRFPLTSNGKVDRRALPEPEIQSLQSSEDYQPPRTPVEELLASLWSQTLGIERVGSHDNFFEMGGHSLLATKLNSRINKAFGIALPLRDIFEFPTIAQLTSVVERGLSSTVEPLPLKPVSRETDLPLSFAQERLWFLDQLEPDNSLYNMSTGMSLKGSVEASLIQRVLSQIVWRHESLRTVFTARQGRPVQVILPAQPFQLPVIDLSGLPEPKRNEEASRLSTEEAWRPFDLSQGPLLRALLLKLGDDHNIVLLTLHHIAGDEWSMDLLSQELAAVYSAFASGEPSPLEELPIQYADYAVWQREYLSGPVLQEQLDYWRLRLSGAPPLLALPLDRPRPSRQTYRGSTQSFRLPDETAQAMRRLSREQGVTLFMTLLGAFQTLLYRYSGERDIVVGTDIAGRTRQELEALIGFFVNQLVMRATLDPAWSFKKLIEQTREICLGAYAHQDAPFERVVEELQPERSLSHSPLFQVSFTLSNSSRRAFSTPNLSVGSAGSAGGELKNAKYDLTLVMVNTPDAMGGAFEYNTDIFDASTMQRMARHFQNLLRSISESADQSLSRLSLLDEQERQQLLVEWNRTEAEYPKQACLHELFEAAARHNPSAIAVICGEQRISYGELDERAEQLAAYLRSRGVRAEQRVGLLLDRSTEMLVGVLGVLKAGGAYVPLDAGYPPSRLAWMLSDAGVTLTLSKRAVVEALKQKSEGIGADVVCLDEELVSLGLEEGKAGKRAEAGNAAYVIYTSGSTGTPKAAVITHEAAVNYTVAVRRELALEPGDRILQFASPSFDVFVEEVFPTWAGGAAVVVMEPEEAEGVLTVEGLNRVLNRYRITGCELPTAFWHEWSRDLKREDLHPSLRLVIVGGENAMRERVKAWRKFEVPLINAYGLTEVTITSIVYSMSPDNKMEDWWEFPIGRPIANTQIYILDQEMQPAPVGVIGELYIGGAGLGRGIWNQADLTAEKYIPNPFGGQPGERLYRT
ncbi:MAG: amino acid adenylation domain-containing protein, partial [Acidobacteriota bacterium]